MLHEKLNNDFHWKNKLEELENLPGETFNKESAWEKLHERMGGKSRTNAALWYWTAAACLLFALILPGLFTSYQKRSGLVETNSVHNQIQSPPPLLPARNKDTSAAISSVSVQKKLPAPSVDKNNKINSLLSHNTIQVKIVHDKKQKEESTSHEINSSVILVDTAIRIVAIFPEKKKLKVVHINELGDPIVETPYIARHSDRHSFQVNIINQDVYTSSLPSTGNTGFNIFKPKNAP